MKSIIVTILGQNYQRQNWSFDFNDAAFLTFFQTLTVELGQLGIDLKLVLNPELVITVDSYADLLNCVKVSSPQDRHHNQCVGHIIGKSARLDIMEDMARAIRRIAFAPETIEPDSAFRKVCHNCGCGC
jgi:hypothetical protein